MTDVERWMRTLFRPGETIELRAKSSQDKGLGWRGWITLDDMDNLLETIIPVNEANERNLWAGVCPRSGYGSGVPAVARVVWADVDGLSPEQTMTGLSSMSLPEPTMVVSSGHGTHLYWMLDRDHKPEEIRAVNRWLSSNVPGADGGVHDPTRVLRIPGTYNFKEPVTPSFLVSHSDTVYTLDSFPRLDSRVERTGTVSDIVTNKEVLTPEAREEFESIWVDGQRHQAALAIAGYLRKEMGWSEREAIELLRSIHFENGGVPGDENDLDLRHCVATTYSKPSQFIRGYQGLKELGVELPDSHPGVILAPKAMPARPSRMKLINFQDDLKPQEFWVDGLVGPGLITLIAAEPKVGKSMLAMQIGHAISNGYPVFDFRTDGKPHSVLYFQGELSQGMVYQRAVDMFPTGTFEDSRRFGMTDKPEKILNLVADPEALMDLAEHYECVIIDPLSVFNANDENSVSSVRETLAVFDALKARGKAVILVHHTRKLESDRAGNTVAPSVSDIRGSGAWFAAVDAVGMLYRKGEAGNAQMRFVYRAAPERPPLNLYRMPHGGFTSNRDTYLRLLAQRGITVDLGEQVLN